MQNKKDLKILKLIEECNFDRVFKELKSTYSKMIINFVKKNNGNDDDGMEIFQESSIKLWQKLQKPEFKITCKISTFLYIIASKLWMDELKRRSRYVYEIDNETSITIEENNDENITSLLKALSELSDTDQKIINMYYFQKMSLNEISVELGYTSEDSVKTRKYKIIKNLNSIYKKIE